MCVCNGKPGESGGTERKREEQTNKCKGSIGKGKELGMEEETHAGRERNGDRN